MSINCYTLYIIIDYCIIRNVRAIWRARVNSLFPPTFTYQFERIINGIHPRQINKTTISSGTSRQ